MKYLDIELSEWQKIGVGLTLFGILFTILGIVLFFDKGFITMGNVLFLSGLALVIGFVKTYQFFFQVRKWRGTLCFMIGLLLILWGRPFFGICFEGVGSFLLFGQFIPTIFNFIEQIPIIGLIVRRLRRGLDRLPE